MNLTQHRGRLSRPGHEDTGPMLTSQAQAGPRYLIDPCCRLNPTTHTQCLRQRRPSGTRRRPVRPVAGDPSLATASSPSWPRTQPRARCASSHTWIWMPSTPSARWSASVSPPRSHLPSSNGNTHLNCCLICVFRNAAGEPGWLADAILEVPGKASSPSITPLAALALAAIAQ
jgi:hypothetical protein